MSDLPPSRLPYRGAVVVHAVLALIILLVAALSRGDLVKAAAVAGAYFVLATAWSWFRFRQRERSAPKGDDTAGDGRRP